MFRKWNFPHSKIQTVDYGLPSSDPWADEHKAVSLFRVLIGFTAPLIGFLPIKSDYDLTPLLEFSPLEGPIPLLEFPPLRGPDRHSTTKIFPFRADASNLLMGDTPLHVLFGSQLRWIFPTQKYP